MRVLRGKEALFLSPRTVVTWRNKDQDIFEALNFDWKAHVQNEFGSARVVRIHKKYIEDCSSLLDCSAMEKLYIAPSILDVDNSIVRLIYIKAARLADRRRLLAAD